MRSGKFNLWPLLGLVLIAAAAFLILEAVGIVDPVTEVMGDISFGQIFGGIVVVAGIIMVLSWRQFWMVFVLLGFLFMIFERNVAAVCGTDGGDILNNWLIFGCSFLLSAGFLLLFSGRKRKKEERKSVSVKVNEKNNKCGITSVYLDCEEFGVTEKECRVENRIGAVEINFENPQSYVGGATLYVDNRVGAVEINVPAEWKVNCDDVRVAMGVLDVNHDRETRNGPELKVKGAVHVGALDICRI